MLCNYGCGQEAKFQLKNGKWCCSKSQNSCKQLKEINKKLNKGRLPWNTGLTKNNNLILKRISEKQTGITYEEKFGDKHIEIKNKKRVSMIGKPSPMKGKNHTEITKEYISKCSKEWWKEHPEEKIRLRKFLKDGWAVYMNTKIKNPSKPELELRKILSLFKITLFFHYPIFRGKGKRNYVVDIAIPELNLIVEYDGWYHFNEQKSILRDKKRQGDIEKLGWKFLRYNIFNKFPTFNQIKTDIESLCKGVKIERIDK